MPWAAVSLGLTLLPVLQLMVRTFGSVASGSAQTSSNTMNACKKRRQQQPHANAWGGRIQQRTVGLNCRLAGRRTCSLNLVVVLWNRQGWRKSHRALPSMILLTLGRVHAAVLGQRENLERPGHSRTTWSSSLDHEHLSHAPFSVTQA